MSINATVLITAQNAPTALTGLYSSPPNATTIIDKMTAYNSTGSAITLDFYFVLSGSTAGATNKVAHVSVGAGALYNFSAELQNHILAGNESIWVQASATACVIRGSGRQVTP